MKESRDFTLFLFIVTGILMLGMWLNATPAQAHTWGPHAGIKRSTLQYCSTHARGIQRRACIVRVVFAPVDQSRKAVSVAWCESRLDPRARNGQYLGIFQMGEDERKRFGHGSTVLAQARAALRYYRVAWWFPWSCA